MGAFTIIGTCSSGILCARFFSSRCCFSAVYNVFFFTLGCRLGRSGAVGLGFSLLGVYDFQDLGFVIVGV